MAKVQLNFYIDAGTKEELKLYAEADGRTVAGLINVILRDWIRAKNRQLEAANK